MADDVAIIGLGVRFPGKATSPEKLWEVLCRGESQWSEFPSDRLNIDGYYHPSGDRQGSISFKGAHFLHEDIAAFDASFFGVSADEAKSIDPQQRLLLEVCYEAIENDYEQICLRDPDWQPKYAATGNGIAIMANRISYFFNLHGPSMTIDTGCSGSLVSVHMAAQGLRSGETSLAIAAGAGMILTPSTMMPMTALNFLSPDGKCFTFDARANGYGRGEGIGVVVLKRLSDALQDRDPIRAIIRGSHSHACQTLTSLGITLPSKEAQVANIRATYASAGLTFEQTAYVECHGTGTRAGDWRELSAISETVATCRTKKNPVIVGSIKPNVGHLEGAAGIAGLIKGVLALEHGQIPPNANFETGNPEIDFENWKVKVPRETLQWPLRGTRRLSVNCFGFGGTNAHVILDEAPKNLQHTVLSNCFNSSQSRKVLAEHGCTDLDHAARSPKLFCFSSQERLGVKRIMATHLPYLMANQRHADGNLLRDYAYTLACRRSRMEWKGAIVAESIDELISGLDKFSQGSSQRCSQAKPRICFVFAGQGSQWAGMSQDLMRYQEFRNSILKASSYIKVSLGSHFDLVEELEREEKDSRLATPELSQPATTAFQVALVDLLASFGARPAVVIGHSSGEIAAAYAAGVITCEEAWGIGYYRGLAAASVSILAPKLCGKMMAIGMSRIEAENYLRSMGESVQIACINSPQSTTISGQADAINYLANDLQKKQVSHRVLDVHVAYHSSQMKLVEHGYEKVLQGLCPLDTDPSVTMISSLTGKEVRGCELNSRYWASNMVSRVEYVAAVQTMLDLSPEKLPDTILELSPRPTLRSPTMATIADAAPDTRMMYHGVADPKIGESRGLLQVMGDLWCRGADLMMDVIMSQDDSHIQPRCLPDLPPYSWNHEKTFWHESHLSQAMRFRKHARQDIIGALAPESLSFEPRWRGYLRISENPWIQDHQVQKTVIYPASGMICMALEAARQLTEDAAGVQGYEITDMRIDKAMVIPATTHGLEVMLAIHGGPPVAVKSGRLRILEFSIYSKILDRDWERNAAGYLQTHHDLTGWQSVHRNDLFEYNRLKAICKEEVAPRQLYELLDVVGLNYGQSFKNIVELHKSANSCVSTIRVPDTSARMPAKFEYPHLIHPATLDAMLHSLFSVRPTPMIPTFIKSIFVSADLGCKAQDSFKGYATAKQVGLFDAEGTVFMSKAGSPQSYVVAGGIRFSAIPAVSQARDNFLPNHRNLCAEILWEQDPYFSSPDSLNEYIRLYSKVKPGLSILQVGFDGQLTRSVLDTLESQGGQLGALSRFTVGVSQKDGSTEPDLSFAKDSALQSVVEMRNLDKPETLPEYDLILILCNSTRFTNALEQRLSSGGIIVSVGNSLLNRDTSVKKSSPPAIHGLTTTEVKPQHPQAAPVLNSNPYGPGSSFSTTVNGCDTAVTVQRPMGSATSLPILDVIVIVPTDAGEETVAFINDIISLAHTKGNRVRFSCLKWEEILAHEYFLKGKAVISLQEFSIAESRYTYDWYETDYDTFHFLQRTVTGVLWITRGAHMNPHNPKASPIVALARTLISEDPLKTFATLDLDIGTPLHESFVPRHVIAILERLFTPLQQAEPRDLEFAEQEGKIYVPRLYPVNSLNRSIQGELPTKVTHRPFQGMVDSPHLGLEVVFGKAGLSDGNMLFKEVRRSELGVNEVEISFTEAPLTTFDLSTVLGRSLVSNLGIDIRGRVRRVGGQVTTFNRGDEVVALKPRGGVFLDTVRVDVQLVKPFRCGMMLSFFVIAYYSLIHIGRVGTRRRVLIHAGASMFGLAAIHIGRAVGAELFVTTLGPASQQQRQHLMEIGVEGHHILDADSDSFVASLLGMTDGRGVDCAFDPTQDHADATLACVKTCGVAVQLTDPARFTGQVKPVPSSITLVNLDFGRLLEEDVDFVVDMLNRMMDLVVRSVDFPILKAPTKVFDLRSIYSALRCIEESPYLGCTLVHDDPDNSLEVPVSSKTPTRPLNSFLDGNMTYILSGGLGGLGRSIATLMVDNGAKHLAFLSRSGAATRETKAWLRDLRKKGVDARAYRVDICDEQRLKAIIKDKVSVDMPPVHGVFQCAAVIKDALFENMSYTEWCTAFRPKTVGSWNLVQAVQATGDDAFFVFLSSSAGVIGNRGQASYAAGNCFQDSLARSLRLQGRRAVSLDLGPILGAGMLAEDETLLDILRASGFYGIRHEDFLKVVEHAITMESLPGEPMPPQVVLGIGTGGIMSQNQPADPYWTRTALYSYLNTVDMPPPDLQITSKSGSRTQNMKSQLAACHDTKAASDVVRAGLIDMLARSMNSLPEDIDAAKPPTAYGVDSLVAVGLRTWVIGNCGVEVSVFEILSDDTVAELAELIAAKRNKED
ncbi:hypothetical protein S40288_03178 [Stachybotrys chartarum IBT 40288]|nr:hypothetical protein S40288_03178 [Stachybotrys chartarum IBT 40288]